MRSLLEYIPGRGTLLLLFEYAKRRVERHTDGAGKLSKARIVSATEELNQIADDVRDAEAAYVVALSTGSPAEIKSLPTVDPVVVATPGTQ